LINDDKIKLSIRLVRSAYDAAKARSASTGSAISVIVAEAATQTLLATYRSDREAEILKAVERVFFKLQKLEKRQNLDLLVLKEMVGLGIRAYFNHTPEVPEHERSASLLSGKARFHRYLDTLAGNLRQNRSILGEVPDLLASPGERNDSAPAESVKPGDPGSTPQQNLDSPPNGNAAGGNASGGEAAGGKAALPSEDSADKRGTKPMVYRQPSGRRIRIGYDEPGLFQKAVQPEQSRPEASPHGVPRKNMAEDS